MVAYEGGEHRHVRAVEADPGGDVPRDDLARDGVVAWPALADVVQQRGDEEQVGAAHAAGQFGGADGRLDEVAVDGPDVYGVALRPAAYALPVRQQPGDQTLRFERLPDLDGGAAGAEERDELFACLGGPGRGEGARGGCHAPYGVQGEGKSRLRGRGRRAQREYGVAFGARGAGEHDLAVLFDDTLGER